MPHGRKGLDVRIETRLKKLESMRGLGIRVEVMREGETENQAKKRLNTDGRSVVFISPVDAEL
jgi:hypothetical protein